MRPALQLILSLFVVLLSVGFNVAAAPNPNTILLNANLQERDDNGRVLALSASASIVDVGENSATSLIVYRPSSVSTHSISIPSPLNAPMPSETTSTDPGPVDGNDQEGVTTTASTDTSRIIHAAGTSSSPSPAVSSGAASPFGATSTRDIVVGAVTIIGSLVVGMMAV